MNISKLSESYMMKKKQKKSTFDAFQNGIVRSQLFRSVSWTCATYSKNKENL